MLAGTFLKKFVKSSNKTRKGKEKEDKAENSAGNHKEEGFSSRDSHAGTKEKTQEDDVRDVQEKTSRNDQNSSDHTSTVDTSPKRFLHKEKGSKHLKDEKPKMHDGDSEHESSETVAAAKFRTAESENGKLFTPVDAENNNNKDAVVDGERKDGHNKAHSELGRLEEKTRNPAKEAEPSTNRPVAKLDESIPIESCPRDTRNLKDDEVKKDLKQSQTSTSSKSDDEQRTAPKVSQIVDVRETNGVQDKRNKRNGSDVIPVETSIKPCLPLSPSANSNQAHASSRGSKTIASKVSSSETLFKDSKSPVSPSNGEQLGNQSQKNSIAKSEEVSEKARNNLTSVSKTAVKDLEEQKEGVVAKKDDEQVTDTQSARGNANDASINGSSAQDKTKHNTESAIDHKLTTGQSDELNVFSLKKNEKEHGKQTDYPKDETEFPSLKASPRPTLKTSPGDTTSASRIQPSSANDDLLLPLEEQTPRQLSQELKAKSRSTEQTQPSRADDDARESPRPEAGAVALETKVMADPTAAVSPSSSFASPIIPRLNLKARGGLPEGTCTNTGNGTTTPGHNSSNKCELPLAHRQYISTTVLDIFNTAAKRVQERSTPIPRPEESTDSGTIGTSDEVKQGKLDSSSPTECPEKVEVAEAPSSKSDNTETETESFDGAERDVARDETDGSRSRRSPHDEENDRQYENRTLSETPATGKRTIVEGPMQRPDVVHSKDTSTGYVPKQTSVVCETHSSPPSIEGSGSTETQYSSSTKSSDKIEMQNSTILTSTEIGQVHSPRHGENAQAKHDTSSYAPNLEVEQLQRQLAEAEQRVACLEEENVSLRQSHISERVRSEKAKRLLAEAQAFLGGNYQLQCRMVEFNLQAMMVEFFHCFEFENTVDCFQAEFLKKKFQMNSRDESNQRFSTNDSPDVCLEKARKRVICTFSRCLELFDTGACEEFFELWHRYIFTNQFSFTPEAERLYFLLQVHFYCYPIRKQVWRGEVLPDSKHLGSVSSDYNSQMESPSSESDNKLRRDWFIDFLGGRMSPTFQRCGNSPNHCLMTDKELCKRIADIPSHCAQSEELAPYFTLPHLAKPFESSKFKEIFTIRTEAEATKTDSWLGTIDRCSSKVDNTTSDIDSKRDGLGDEASDGQRVSGEMTRALPAALRRAQQHSSTPKVLEGNNPNRDHNTATPDPDNFSDGLLSGSKDPRFDDTEKACLDGNTSHSNTIDTKTGEPAILQDQIADNRSELRSTICPWVANLRSELSLFLVKALTETFVPTLVRIYQSFLSDFEALHLYIRELRTEISRWQDVARRTYLSSVKVTNDIHTMLPTISKSPRCSPSPGGETFSAETDIPTKGGVDEDKRDVSMRGNKEEVAQRDRSRQRSLADLEKYIYQARKLLISYDLEMDKLKSRSSVGKSVADCLRERILASQNNAAAFSLSLSKLEIEPHSAAKCKLTNFSGSTLDFLLQEIEEAHTDQGPSNLSPMARSASSLEREWNRLSADDRQVLMHEAGLGPRKPLDFWEGDKEGDGRTTASAGQNIVLNELTEASKRNGHRRSVSEAIADRNFLRASQTPLDPDALTDTQAVRQQQLKSTETNEDSPLTNVDSKAVVLPRIKGASSKEVTILTSSSRSHRGDLGSVSDDFLEDASVKVMDSQRSEGYVNSEPQSQSKDSKNEKRKGNESSKESVCGPSEPSPENPKGDLNAKGADAVEPKENGKASQKHKEKTNVKKKKTAKAQTPNDEPYVKKTTKTTLDEAEASKDEKAKSTPKNKPKKKKATKKKA